MRCRIVQLKLADYSVNLLSPRRAAALARHLEQCSTCQGEWRRFQAVLTATEQLAPKATPDSLWTAVAKGIDEQQTAGRTAGAQLPHLNCGRARRLFGGYSADVLGERQRRRVRYHLETCTECQGEWRQFQGVLALVDSLEPQSPPLFLWERVRDRIHRPRPVSTWWRQPRAIPAFAGALAVAAAVTFAVVRKAEAPSPAPMGTAQVASNLDFIQQHAAMAQNELFSDKAALGTLVNYVPADYRR